MSDGVRAPGGPGRQGRGGALSKQVAIHAKTRFREEMLMRKIGILVLAALTLGSVVVFSAGCGGEEQKAQDMVKGANPSVVKGNQQVTKLRDVWAKIQKLPDSPTGYKQGAALAKEGATAATAAEGDYKKVADAVVSAKKLDISPEYKKYMGMKEAALKARIDGLSLSAQRFTQVRKLYIAALARNIKNWKAASAKIKTLSGKIAKLPDSDKLDAAANAFGKKKGIGG